MKASICGLLLFALSADCYGGLFMSFTSDGTAQPLTTINVGQTATLDVYLRQTAGEFNAPPYNSGLISGGVQLDFGPEVQVTAFTQDSAWEFSSLGPSSPPLSGLAELSTYNIDFAYGPILPVSDAIRLGRVAFQGIAPGLATIGFSDFAGDQFVLDDLGGTSIDAVVNFVANNAQIQVNGAAVPEPGALTLSLLLLGAASTVTCYRARRKRKPDAAGAGLPTESGTL